MSSEDDHTLDIKAFLHCKTCNNGRLSVGLSTDDELVIACDQCNQVVLLVREWPNPKLAGIKCHACEAGKCDKDHTIN